LETGRIDGSSNKQRNARKRERLEERYAVTHACVNSRQMDNPEPREDHESRDQTREHCGAVKQQANSAGDQQHAGELTPPNGIPWEPRGKQTRDDFRKLEMLASSND
jgi:hypothetical protein